MVPISGVCNVQSVQVEKTQNHSLGFGGELSGHLIQLPIQMGKLLHEEPGLHFLLFLRASCSILTQTTELTIRWSNRYLEGRRTDLHGVLTQPWKAQLSTGGKPHSRKEHLHKGQCVGDETSLPEQVTPSQTTNHWLVQARGGHYSQLSAVPLSSHFPHKHITRWGPFSPFLHKHVAQRGAHSRCSLNVDFMAFVHPSNLFSTKARRSPCPSTEGSGGTSLTFHSSQKEWSVLLDDSPRAVVKALWS